MAEQSSYGEVSGPRVGEMTRRGFMRRMLGVGVGILGLEVLGGTVAMLWPNLQGGLGGRIALGTVQQIAQNNPDWAAGQPYSYNQGRLFLVNKPAAMAFASGETVSIPDPGGAENLLALYRKCPHLGCQIPPLCQASRQFECLCHGSKYNIIGEKTTWPNPGPAPRGMDRFPVVLEGDEIIVDTSETIVGPPLGSEEFKEPSEPTERCTG